MFFPHHLVGPDEVQSFIRGWIDSLGVVARPAGAPDCDLGSNDMLDVRPLVLRWTDDASLRLRLIVDADRTRPAEPVQLSANFTRDGRPSWRYCRNDHHPQLGRDHLHLDGDTQLIGLTDSLTLKQITSRLLSEPR